MDDSSCSQMASPVPLKNMEQTEASTHGEATGLLALAEVAAWLDAATAGTGQEPACQGGNAVAAEHCGRTTACPPGQRPVQQLPVSTMPAITHLQHLQQQLREALSSLQQEQQQLQLQQQHALAQLGSQPSLSASAATNSSSSQLLQPTLAVAVPAAAPPAGTSGPLQSYAAVLQALMQGSEDTGSMRPAAISSTLTAQILRAVNDSAGISGPDAAHSAAQVISAVPGLHRAPVASMAQQGHQASTFGPTCPALPQLATLLQSVPPPPAATGTTNSNIPRDQAALVQELIDRLDRNSQAAPSSLSAELQTSTTTVASLAGSAAISSVANAKLQCNTACQLPRIAVGKLPQWVAPWLAAKLQPSTTQRSSAASLLLEYPQQQALVGLLAQQRQQLLQQAQQQRLGQQALLSSWQQQPSGGCLLQQPIQLPLQGLPGMVVDQKQQLRIALLQYLQTQQQQVQQQQGQVPLLHVGLPGSQQQQEQHNLVRQQQQQQVSLQQLQAGRAKQQQPARQLQLRRPDLVVSTNTEHQQKGLQQVPRQPFMQPVKQQQHDVQHMEQHALLGHSSSLLAQQQQQEEGGQGQQEQQLGTLQLATAVEHAADVSADGQQQGAGPALQQALAATSAAVQAGNGQAAATALTVAANLARNAGEVANSLPVVTLAQFDRGSPLGAQQQQQQPHVDAGLLHQMSTADRQESAASQQTPSARHAATVALSSVHPTELQQESGAQQQLQPGNQNSLGGEQNSTAQESVFSSSTFAGLDITAGVGGGASALLKLVQQQQLKQQQQAHVQQQHQQQQDGRSATPEVKKLRQRQERMCGLTAGALSFLPPVAASLQKEQVAARRGRQRALEQYLQEHVSILSAHVPTVPAPEPQAAATRTHGTKQQPAPQQQATPLAAVHGGTPATAAAPQMGSSQTAEAAAAGGIAEAAAPADQRNAAAGVGGGVGYHSGTPAEEPAAAPSAAITNSQAGGEQGKASHDGTRMLSLQELAGTQAGQQLLQGLKQLGMLPADLPATAQLTLQLALTPAGGQSGNSATFAAAGEQTIEAAEGIVTAAQQRGLPPSTARQGFGAVAASLPTQAVEEPGAAFSGLGSAIGRKRPLIELLGPEALAAAVAAAKRVLQDPPEWKGGND